MMASLLRACMTLGGFVTSLSPASSSIKMEIIRLMFQGYKPAEKEMR